jgi:hypothetical protein
MAAPDRRLNDVEVYHLMPRSNKSQARSLETTPDGARAHPSANRSAFEGRAVTNGMPRRPFSEIEIDAEKTRFDARAPRRAHRGCRHMPRHRGRGTETTINENPSNALHM